MQTHPDHLRAWAYLGLVHERLGDYEKARASFLRGEQPGMARRMDDLLASGAPPRSLSVPPPGPKPQDGATTKEMDSKRPLEAFHDLEREVTLTGIPAIPRIASVPPARPPSERPAPPPVQNGPHASHAGEEGPPIIPFSHISIGPPPPAPVATISTTPSGFSEIGTLTRLARESLLKFPSEPGLFRHPSGLVLARVESSFAARLSDIQLLAGDAQSFKHERLLRRMRNRTLDESLGGAETPIVSLGGAGYLALGPREGEQLVAFRMDGDFLFVREAVLDRIRELPHVRERAARGISR